MSMSQKDQENLRNFSIWKEIEERTINAMHGPGLEKTSIKLLEELEKFEYLLCDYVLDKSI